MLREHLHESKKPFYDRRASRTAQRAGGSNSHVNACRLDAHDSHARFPI